LILRKLSKIGATRYQILRLKCTKFDFRWGSAPDPASRWGSLQHSPRPSSCIKGDLVLRGGRGKGGGKRRGKEMEGEGRRGKGREGIGREGREERGMAHAQ